MDFKSRLRWFISYRLGFCDFLCKYRGNTCKLHLGKIYLCDVCDNRIYDMCGHCIYRPICGWPRRQTFAFPDNWE